MSHRAHHHANTDHSQDAEISWVHFLDVPEQKCFRFTDTRGNILIPEEQLNGDITQSGDERVVGHKLSDDGKVCETLYEPTSAVEKFIPSTNQATNAIAIAVIATAGATATPIILRIVKPILTKIWKTIQKKMGKKVDLPSRAEIRANKYREKKGLPPLKKKN